MAQNPLIGCLTGMGIGHLFGLAIEDKQQTIQGFRELIPKEDAVEKPLPLSDDLRFIFAVLGAYLSGKDLGEDQICSHFLSAYEGSYLTQGPQTSAVYLAIKDGQMPIPAAQQAWERSSRKAAGSGGLKRALPAALWYASSIKDLENETRKLSQFTHPDPRCTDAAISFNRILSALLRKEWNHHRDLPRYLIGLTPTMGQALQAANLLPLVGLSTSGYAITMVQAAYRTMNASKDFAEALLEFLSIGGKTGTSGMLAGAILGARWGLSSIPKSWLEMLPEPFSQTLYNNLSARRS